MTQRNRLDPPSTSPADLLARVEVVLHRPQSSDNIGSVARAMKNFGLSRLVLVAPPRYDRVRAGVLAVHAGDLLDAATVAPSLDEAIGDHVLVVPTSGRHLEGRAPPLSPREAARRLLEQARTGRVALIFGEEATGLNSRILARFPDYSSIPADPGRTSLNLAMAVLLYAWELRQASGAIAAQLPPEGEPAPLRLVGLLRERARELLLRTGFLNPQAPDHVLDELFRLLLRAGPNRREVEMLLAALAQLERASADRARD